MPEPSNLADIAKALEVLGMSVEEGRAYLYLLQAGPSKVGDIAPYFEASRSKLYRILDGLSRKGFVSKTPTRPTVYHPVFPEDAFEIGEEQIEQRREHLEEVREELLGALRRLHRAVEAPEPTTWTKVEGLNRIYDVVQRVVRNAQASILVASNKAPPVAVGLPFVRETWSATKKRVEEDVTARCVFGTGEKGLENVPTWLIDEGLVRVVDVDQPVHFLIVDEDKVVFWLEAEGVGASGAGDEVAVFTDAGGPVGTHVLLFQHLWSRGAQAPSGT